MTPVAILEADNQICAAYVSKVTEELRKNDGICDRKWENFSGSAPKMWHFAVVAAEAGNNLNK